MDRNDIHHADAKRFYSQVAEKEALALCLPVLTEAWLLIEARLGSHAANLLWKSASEGVFDLLDLDQDDLKKAYEIESKYRRAHLGVVDCACFALCEKRHIRRVFTYDLKHFRIYRPTFALSLELLP